MKLGADGENNPDCTLKQLGTDFHWFVYYIDMIFTKLNTEVWKGYVLGKDHRTSAIMVRITHTLKVD